MAHAALVVLTALIEMAARSPGCLLDHAQLRSLGADRRRVWELVKAGVLTPATRGLFRVSCLPVPPAQSLHVAVRYLSKCRPSPPPMLLSGEANLALRSVEGFPLPVRRPLMLLARDDNVRLSRPPFDVRYVAVEDIPCERMQGIDCADPAQALADYALNRNVGDARLRASVDALRWRSWVPLPALTARWQDIGHDGARRLLDMGGDLELESGGERSLAALFRRHPPMPDCQVVVHGNLRADFVFVFAALIIEYLGQVHAGQLDRDVSRDFALEHPGYRVIWVTKAMLRDDPAAIAAHIHAVRREREQLLMEGRLARPALPAQPPRLTALQTLCPLG